MFPIDIQDIYDYWDVGLSDVFIGKRKNRNAHRSVGKMKFKKFDDYLKKRLRPQEILEIQHQVEVEFESLVALQTAGGKND